MVNDNTNLRNAAKTKNDDFYTQYADIEKEMSYYKDYFKDKIVYCNTDNADSNFVKYFVDNFESLGLREVIATSYADEGKGEGYIYNGSEYKVKLKGNGDFRSKECETWLKKADVVVTNPPFSLFREFVSQLMEFNKDFIIIGNGNAVTYKEVFQYIKNDLIWLGASKGMGGKAMEFLVDEEFYDSTKGTMNRTEDGKYYVSVMMCTWFTNIPHSKRNEELILTKSLNEGYIKYDNYDAIEVPKTKDIPMDYNGVMGVPISFLDKYCPTQFEILGLAADKRDDCEWFIKGEETYLDDKHKRFVGMVLNGKATYARLLIKRRLP
jgi:hypothetical protein